MPPPEVPSALLAAALSASGAPRALAAECAGARPRLARADAAALAALAAAPRARAADAGAKAGAQAAAAAGAFAAGALREALVHAAEAAGNNELPAFTWDWVLAASDSDADKGAPLAGWAAICDALVLAARGGRPIAMRVAVSTLAALSARGARAEDAALQCCLDRAVCCASRGGGDATAATAAAALNRIVLGGGTDRGGKLAVLGVHARALSDGLTAAAVELAAVCGEGNTGVLIEQTSSGCEAAMFGIARAAAAAAASAEPSTAARSLASRLETAEGGGALIAEFAFGAELIEAGSAEIADAAALALLARAAAQQGEPRMVMPLQAAALRCVARRLERHAGDRTAKALAQVASPHADAIEAAAGLGWEGVTLAGSGSLDGRDAAARRAAAWGDLPGTRVPASNTAVELWGEKPRAVLSMTQLVEAAAPGASIGVGATGQLHADAVSAAGTLARTLVRYRLAAARVAAKDAVDCVVAESVIDGLAVTVPAGLGEALSDPTRRRAGVGRSTQPGHAATHSRGDAAACRIAAAVVGELAHAAVGIQHYDTAVRRATEAMQLMRAAMLLNGGDNRAAATAVPSGNTERISGSRASLSRLAQVVAKQADLSNDQHADLLAWVLQSVAAAEVGHRELAGACDGATPALRIESTDDLEDDESDVTLADVAILCASALKRGAGSTQAGARGVRAPMRDAMLSLGTIALVRAHLRRHVGPSASTSRAAKAVAAVLPLCAAFTSTSASDSALLSILMLEAAQAGGADGYALATAAANCAVRHFRTHVSPLSTSKFGRGSSLGTGRNSIVDLALTALDARVVSALGDADGHVVHLVSLALAPTAHRPQSHQAAKALSVAWQAGAIASCANSVARAVGSKPRRVNAALRRVLHPMCTELHSALKKALRREMAAASGRDGSDAVRARVGAGLLLCAASHLDTASTHLDELDLSGDELAEWTAAIAEISGTRCKTACGGGAMSRSRKKLRLDEGGSATADDGSGVGGDASAGFDRALSAFGALARGALRRLVDSDAIADAQLARRVASALDAACGTADPPDASTDLGVQQDNAAVGAHSNGDAHAAAQAECDEALQRLLSSGVSDAGERPDCDIFAFEWPLSFGMNSGGGHCVVSGGDFGGVSLDDPDDEAMLEPSDDDDTEDSEDSDDAEGFFVKNHA